MIIQTEIDDGLVDTLKRHLPPGWTVDDWIQLKAEQAIAQAHLDKRRQDAQRAAQARTTPDGTPDLRTNDDVQQARADVADEAADD